MQSRRDELRSDRSVRRAWLVCALALLCATRLWGQQYRYDQWTADNNGLPQNIIRGIAQTRDGYLWIATLDGLTRFDGVRFTVFNKANTPQILSNRISAMAQDAGGDLWMVNESGDLTRYAEGKFHTYGPEEGIPARGVHGILRDSAGRIWLLAGDSILRWDRERGRPVDATPPGRRMRYEPLRWGNGFWSADGTALHIFTEGRVEDLRLPQGMTGPQVGLVVAMDENGTVWLDCLNGNQAIIRAGQQSAERVDPTVPRTFSWHDGHGQVWNYHVGPRLTRSLDFESSGKIASLPMARWFEDREGNLWVGTEGSGLYRLRRESIRSLSKDQGLLERNVSVIDQDPSGDVWVGVWPGLSRVSGSGITNYTMRDGLPGPQVSSLAVDHNGGLWVGTRDGVAVYHAGKFSALPGLVLPALASPQAMVEDRGGTMWIGTPYGLVHYRDRTSSTLTTRDGLAADDVRTIVESRSGDMWFGGYGGLTRMHGHQFTRWTEREGLPSNNIRALYEDSDGVLWIGTYDGGLGRLKDGRLTRYSEKDGFFNNGVFQILEDGQGNLWMSSNRGIYRVRKDDLNAFAEEHGNGITSVAYGRSDGMLNAECNGGFWPAGIKTRNGELWFPTQDGVAIVDPATVRTNPQPPPVAIETALVDHVPVVLEGRELRVPPGRQNLEIQYTAPSFIHSEHIRFRYKLEGLDSDWIDAGARRTAYYSHLPAGNYVFQVIARNSDGVWNMTGQSLHIAVLAPFYQKWWFTLLELLVVAGLVAAIVRYRLAQLEHREALQKAFSQQLIASQESERQRIAAELHDSLGQRLVVINNLALLAMRPRKTLASSNGLEEDTLKEISTETALAIEETREISYNLRPFQLDRLGLTKAVEGIARSVATASGIAVTARVDNVDDAFPEDLRINFYRIVQESLNNVLKHALATEVELRVIRSESGVALTIRDNGVGFAVAHRAARNGKSGFGLTGMAERANLLGGVFHVTSVPGQGTVMTVEIPVGERIRG